MSAEAVSLAAMVAAPGLALGSFLNVVASRLPRHRSIGASRSECMSCGAQIRWSDNIPLVSYALLRGRCRACHASIPVRYPIVEATTAILAVASVLRFGLTAEAALAVFFCATLVAIAAIDVEHRIVPNRIVIPAAVVTLGAHTAIDPSPEWALGAAAAFAVLFAIALLNPRGMGMGDVKLCLLLGAMLGWQVFVALLLGVLLGTVPAIVLAFKHGMGARKLAIPFAPFLVLGALTTLFVGDALLDWWSGLFSS